MTESDSNNQPPVEERLSRIENTLREVATGQQLIISKLGSIEADLSALKVEVAEIKEDAKLRYVDLRERIDLNRDKLGIMQRELNQLIKDLTNPPFASAPTR
ncbi:MAG: hypothetical protein MOB07_08655 [Acidobacteria bacterium]|nr:hypothetical protein [Acidobacteriota bacterium]